MRHSVWIVMTLAACVGGGPTQDPFDPEAEAELPGWIDDALEGEEDACSSSPLWDDPDVHIATSFFAGNFFWDGDDEFVGNEFWLIWPDEDLAETGFEPCQLVWDVFGNRTEASAGGDYGLTLTAQLDDDHTTCPEDSQGTALGDETFTTDYTVNEFGGGNLNIFFPSGTQLGSGEVTNNGISWLSEKDCLIL